jgi:hypothetical protein
VLGGRLVWRARARRAVRENTVVQGTDVAAVVESSTQDVVVERTMTWSSGRGGHHGTGVTAPALDWYLAEGTSYGDFATYVTIANPGAVATEVQVTFTPDTTCRAWAGRRGSRRSCGA